MKGDKPAAPQDALQEYFQKKQRYVAVGNIGRGGMAEVLEYMDEYFHRPTAYKTLRANRRQPQAVKEFVREAQVMGRLEHPGIAPVYHLVRDEHGLPGITMCRLQGAPLNTSILKASKNPASWPLAERVQVFARLVEVVDYAHSKGVLHRDLKPSNIMIGPRGELTLLDWGLAKFKHQAEEDAPPPTPDESTLMEPAYESVKGSIKGTPLYMSPETAQGRSELVDEKNDIFSLGVLLFEMLTFRHLIPGETPQEILVNAAAGRYDYAPLDSQRNPRDLVYIVKKCTQPDAAQRYESAGALRKDIYSFQNGLPLADFERNFAVLFLKWLKRNGRSFALFLVMGGLFAYAAHYLGQQIYDRVHKIEEVDKSIEGLEVKIQNTKQQTETAQAHREKLEAVKRDREKKAAQRDQGIGKIDEDLQAQLKEKDAVALRIKGFQEEVAKLEKRLQEQEAKNAAGHEEVSRMRAKWRDDTRQERAAIFLAYAPVVGLTAARAREEFEGGRRLNAIAAMEDLKLDHPASGLVLASLRRGASSESAEAKEGEAPVSHYEGKELEWAEELLRLPGKSWRHILEHADPHGVVLVAQDGSAVFAPEKGRPAFEPLPVHERCPRFIALQGETCFGLYTERRAFLQPSLREPPQPVALPGPPSRIWLEKGALKAHCGDRIYTFPAVPTVPQLEDHPWCKPLDNANRQPHPAAAKETVNLPQGAKALVVGATHVLASAFPGSPKLHNWDLGKQHFGDNWEFPSAKLAKAVGVADGSWLALDRDGRLFHLRPGHPSRPVLLSGTAKADGLFGLPGLNLAIATAGRQYYLLLFNTGQVLLDLGRANEDLADAWEGKNESIVLEFSSGRQVLLARP